MDTGAILTGTELYRFFTDYGSADLQDSIEAGEKMTEAGLSGDKMNLALDFARCAAGLYQYVCQYVPFDNCGKEIEIFFLLTSKTKRTVAVCLAGPVDGYVIYAGNLAETVNRQIMEQLDHGRMISQEAYLVTQALCLARRQLLKDGIIKPIKRKDYCKTFDPELKKTIKFFDENFSPMEKISGKGTISLELEFDIMVIEDLAISKIEWGMSLDELMALVKFEVSRLTDR